MSATVEYLTCSEAAGRLGVRSDHVAVLGKEGGWKSVTGERNRTLWRALDVEAERSKRLATDKRLSDGFSRRGAEQLAANIREYWLKRGRTVTVTVEKADGFMATLRTADWYVVRSDLVNGWPR